MVGKLTEKRLNNKRFRATEESILLACLNIKGKLTPCRLIRTARISRATFYRHHDGVANIAPDYEAYILYKVKADTTRLTKIKGVHLSTLYEHLLTLIYTNRKIIIFLLDFGNPDFLESMLLILEPSIIAATKIKKREVLLIHIGEVAALVKAWRATDFDRQAIPALVDKIMYLTNTAFSRLSALGSFDGQREPRVLQNGVENYKRQ